MISTDQNILIYVDNNLVSNQPLKKQFHNLLQVAYEQCENQMPLSESTEDYLFIRLIKIYMRSRQRSWRRFKEYIPEKGSSSLRENVKTMNADLKYDMKKDMPKVRPNDGGTGRSLKKKVKL